MLRKRRANGLLKIVATLLIVGLLALLFFSIQGVMKSNEEEDARKVIEQFYTYEQEGDFGSSWELFHSLLQERYKKPDYVQTRAHVFMQHFGTNTFKYEVSEPERLFDVQLIEGKEALAEVYQFTVTQIYHSSFGNFKMVQPVYASQESGEWRVLWSFDKAQEF
ncbi:hypothetical protein PUW24_13505 [Paenibacillus urinalis]|uniref:NTF2-like N-terminal transpeptidase domain-containing protein n=1 Tax=Paenibacillus urinalis TaxID=521520 RepID=A0ABY7XCI9_9BACL|nr:MULTISPECIES: hypothetical protein [Paenibacillus]WDH99821.1 hypothetical protein PUW24_13505 [Paenibacillus urinalis]WDI03451.1 hypothetical protein PUW25_05630 [Paenibacillus urinalis]GAK41100.1 hypothetical protein TCA2_3591 [Paenibacillus sp. TCA20]